MKRFHAKGLPNRLVLESGRVCFQCSRDEWVAFPRLKQAHRLHRGPPKDDEQAFYIARDRRPPQPSPPTPYNLAVKRVPGEDGENTPLQLPHCAPAGPRDPLCCLLISLLSSAPASAGSSFCGNCRQLLFPSEKLLLPWKPYIMYMAQIMRLLWNWCDIYISVVGFLFTKTKTAPRWPCRFGRQAGEMKFLPSSVGWKPRPYLHQWTLAVYIPCPKRHCSAWNINKHFPWWRAIPIIPV